MLKVLLTSFLIVQFAPRYQSQDVRSLIQTLTEATKNYDTRDKRFRDVVKLGPAAYPELLRIAADRTGSERTRTYALLAVQHIGKHDAAAVQGLSDLFKAEEKPALRGHTLLALSSLASAEDLPRLTTLYADEKDPALKSSLMTVVATAGKEKAEAFLIERLTQGGPDEKLQVIRIVAGFRLAGAVPHLLEVLKSDQPNVASEAAGALGRITGITVGSLDDRKKKWEAWWSARTQKTDAPRIVETVPAEEARKILSALTGADAAAREQAEADVLNKGKAILPQLREYAATAKEETAKSALKKYADLIEWNVEADLYRSDPEVLSKLTEPDHHKRLAFVVDIKERKDIQYRKVLCRFLTDPSADIREQAVDALGQMRAVEAFQDMVNVLFDADDNVRIAAIDALAKLENRDEYEYVRGDRGDRAAPPPAQGELVKLLFDRSLSVRLAACEALGDMHAASSLHDLGLALKDPDWRMRAKVAEVLGKLRAGEAARYLKEALNDSDSFVKATALQALTKLDVETAMPHLITILRNEEGDPEVFVNMLRKMGYSSAHVAELVKLATEKKGRVRRELLKYMAENKESAAAPIIGELLKTGTDEEKTAALHAMATVPSKEFVPAAQGFLVHKEKDVRVAALKGIIPNDPDHVTDHLLRGLGDADPEVQSYVLWLIPRLATASEIAIDKEATDKAAEKEGYKVTVVEEGSELRISRESDGGGRHTSIRKGELGRYLEEGYLSEYGVIVSKKSLYTLDRAKLMPVVQKITTKEPLVTLLQSGVLLTLGEKDRKYLKTLMISLTAQKIEKFWTDQGLTGGSDDLKSWVVKVVIASKNPDGISGLEVLANLPGEGRDLKHLMVHELTGVKEGKKLLLKLAQDTDETVAYYAVRAVKDMLEKEDVADVIRISARPQHRYYVEDSLRRFLSAHVTEDSLPQLIEALNVSRRGEDREDSNPIVSMISNFLKEENLHLLLDRVKKITPDKDLSDSERSFILNSFHLLGRFDTPVVHELVRAWIKSKDVRIRMAAVERLHRFDRDAAKSVLTAMLDDPSMDVVVFALKKLKGSTDDKYKAAVKKVLDSEKKTDKLEAARILMELGDPKGQEVIVSLLNDRETAEAALESLRGSADPSLIPHLAKILMSGSDEFSSSYRVVEILQQIDHDDARKVMLDFVLKGPPASSKEYMLQTLWMKAKDKEAFKPTLMQILKTGDEYAKSGAIQILGQMGDRGSLALIRPLLQSPSRRIKRSAVSALGQLKDTESVAAIAALLKDDENSDAAVQALSQIGGPESAKHLVTVLGHREEYYRRNAATLLKTSRDQSIIPELLKMAEEDDGIASAAAIDVLSAYKGDPAVVPVFTKMLKEGNTKAKRVAIDVLSEMKDPSLVKPLIEAYEDASGRLKVKVINAIVQAGSKESVPFLKGIVTDGSGRAKREALKGLLLLDVTDGSRELFVEVLKEDSPFLKRYALRYFALTWDDRAYDHVLAALSDDNPDIASEAVHAIGYSGKKEAAQKLVSMFKDAPVPLKPRIMESVARLDREALLPLLRESVTSEAFVVVDRAMDLLFHGGYPEGLEHFRKLVDHENWKVRMRALKYLVRLDRPNGIEKLKQLMDKTMDEEKSRELYDLVQSETVKEVGDLLFKKLTSGDMRSANFSATTLGSLEYTLTTEEQVSRLLKAFDRGDDEDRGYYTAGLPIHEGLRPKLWIKALTDLNDAHHRKLLGVLVHENFARPAEKEFYKKMLTDKNVETRRIALRGLGSVGSEEDLKDVKPLLKDADEHIRSEAAAILALWGDPEGVEHLRKSMDSEKGGLHDFYSLLILKQNGVQVNKLKELIEKSEHHDEEWAFYRFDDAGIFLRFDEGKQYLLKRLADPKRSGVLAKAPLALVLAENGVPEGRQWIIEHLEEISYLWNLGGTLGGISDAVNIVRTQEVRSRAVAILIENSRRAMLLDFSHEGTSSKKRSQGEGEREEQEEIAAPENPAPIFGMNSSVLSLFAAVARHYLSSSPFESKSDYERWSRWWAGAKEKSAQEWKREGIAGLIQLLDHTDPDERANAHKYLKDFTMHDFPFDPYGKPEDRTKQIAAWKTWWDQAKDKDEMHWFVSGLQKKGYVKDIAGFKPDSPEGLAVLGKVLSQEAPGRPLIRFTVDIVGKGGKSYLPAMIDGLGNKEHSVREHLVRLLIRLTGKYGGHNPHAWRHLTR